MPAHFIYIYIYSFFILLDYLRVQLTSRSIQKGGSLQIVSLAIFPFNYFIRKNIILVTIIINPFLCLIPWSIKNCSFFSTAFFKLSLLLLLFPPTFSVSFCHLPHGFSHSCGPLSLSFNKCPLCPRCLVFSSTVCICSRTLCLHTHKHHKSGYACKENTRFCPKYYCHLTDCKLPDPPIFFSP